ncbi:sigma-70 family RNA polymerase sigma factor [Hamadaea sp. NPDC050747]|uniref:RNA polymerase sigma factor n=1 Tax=Hamadaea sp. NPDC050747 TaxID=3155789 RepID=UPI0034027F21
MRTGDSDARLRERLVGGDDDALAEIYDSWSALVYSMAVRITGDRSGAQDVTQDVFVHLWERPEAYDPGRGSLRTWLCVTTRGRALDWIRRTETRRRYQTAAASPEIAEAAVDEGILWQTEVKAVRAAVQALPAPQREAVTLAYFHERTYREVARDLSIPEGTAKSRLRVGLAHLADLLKAEGIID